MFPAISRGITFPATATACLRTTGLMSTGRASRSGFSASSPATPRRGTRITTRIRSASTDIARRSPRVIIGSAPIYGGVALEMSLYDADVYVDGTYAGRVEDFDGSKQPLTLVPGTHRIEVQAPGYAPLTFDVGVQAGQVIPYRGDLQPY